MRYIQRMDGEAACQSKNCGFGRGDREILHGLTLSIPTGWVTGLIAPSGCGKTTLIRAIVGVQVCS